MDLLLKRLEKQIWRQYFGIINLYLNRTKPLKNRNILLEQVTNTSHPHNKVVAVVNSNLRRQLYLRGQKNERLKL